MKKRIVLMTLALSMALTTSALAMEVPTNTVVQNLNGSQQVIKTYTLSPGTDPQDLIEEPFELEGYHHLYHRLRHTHLPGCLCQDHLQYGLELSAGYFRQPHHTDHLPSQSAEKKSLCPGC